MIKTFVVVLSSDSNLTPSMLTEKVALMGGVEAKETCYGILVEGEEDRVKEVLEELRKLDPNRVFFKVRGYRIGDERICRAKRGGGPRPGYHMLSVEREALKNVAKALDSPDSKAIERPSREKTSAEKIKSIIEEGGSN